MDLATLGLILSVLTAASALVVQLQRLLQLGREYMVELRHQNETTNAAVQAAVALDAARKAP